MFDNREKSNPKRVPGGVEGGERKKKRYGNASLEVYCKMILMIVLHIYSLMKLGYNLSFK